MAQTTTNEASEELPSGFREGHQGDLACPHRDCSVCPKCAAAYPEIVEVRGGPLLDRDRGGARGAARADGGGVAMWQSERQQCDVIRKLLLRVRLDRLWTPTGPTKEACDLLKRGGGPLSHGEALMLGVAFDVWNGHGRAEIGEMLGVLDDGNLRAVVEAMLARDGVHPV